MKLKINSFEHHLHDIINFEIKVIKKHTKNSKIYPTYTSVRSDTSRGIPTPSLSADNKRVALRPSGRIPYSHHALARELWSFSFEYFKIKFLKMLLNY